MSTQLNPWAPTPDDPFPPAHPDDPVDAIEVSAWPLSIAPAVSPARWSGKKTAIAAALAIGFASVGAAGAAALPTGAGTQDGPGGAGRQFPVGQFPGGQFPGGPVRGGHFGGGHFGQQGPQQVPGQQSPTAPTG